MLRFGQIVIARRSEIAQLEAETEAWKARAEAMVAELALIRARQFDPPPKPSLDLRNKWPTVMRGAWILIIGIIVGGLAIPHHYDRPSLSPDLPTCIGQARYKHQIPDNQYQELVNALYSCDVYGASS